MPPNQQNAPRRAFIESAAVFLGCFLLYISNWRFQTSGDTVPNSLLAFNLIQNHRLDFDNFRDCYLYHVSLGYGFIPAKSAHTSSVFPVGTAVLTFPLYACFFVILKLAHVPLNLTSAAFESTRLLCEKAAAAITAAATVTIFHSTVRLKFPRMTALLSTAIFAFCTGMWTTASQALWQHTAVTFLLTTLLASLLRANGPTRPHRATLILAGLCCGLLPGVRPTAAVFSLAALAYVLVTFRRQCVWTFAAAAVAAVPCTVWNLYFFHNPLGGYATTAHMYAFSHAFLTAVSGLLLSPSRGLLIYTPALLACVFAIPHILRPRDNDARLLRYLVAASIITILNYGFYRMWWAGSSYGPRYLTDILPVACFLLTYALAPTKPHPLFSAVMTVFIAFSLFAQFVGAYSEPNEWNAIPVNVDVQPSRLWSLRDCQIERHAKWFYRRAAGPHLKSDYLRSLAGYADNLRLSTPTGDRPLPDAATIPPGPAILKATLHNTGQAPWYPYQSAMERGRIAVRVELRGTDDKPFTIGWLYLAEPVPPGGQGEAVGNVTFPTQPGACRASFYPLALQLGGFPTSADTTAPLRLGWTVAP